VSTKSPLVGDFKRAGFEVVKEIPANCRKLRFWDMASTEKTNGNDPDWTAGALVALSKQGVWYLADMRRTRGTPMQVENLIKQTAMLDGVQVPVRIEQEGGASGKTVIDHYARNVLVGFAFQGIPAAGRKEVRAQPVRTAAQAGNFKLLEGPWNHDFLAEAEGFPNGAHDDQIDAVSGAVAGLGPGVNIFCA
jgi:predicted phage terminase large subunit-like protein